jgi:hypothetical protein
MNFVVVILSGPAQHLTTATVEFGRWGTKTNQPIMICDTWEQGFNAAKQKFNHALFVKSGTIFTDWEQWQQLLSHYPHKGLIAHIIWHPLGIPDINDQCWFVDLSKFTVTDLTKSVTFKVPQRSQKNLHDDYTPLWISPGVNHSEITSSGLGAHLISQSLNRGDAVVNWNNSARDIKKFIYQDGQDSWQSWLSDYFELSEHQLWVLNNETVCVPRVASLLTPGSGLYWTVAAMLGTTDIHVVDISATQIAFCKHIWQNWNGRDYGTFAWEFIQNNQIGHYELDRANLSTADRSMYNMRDNFISHVDQSAVEIFNNHGITDPVDQWSLAKTQCSVQFSQDNIIEYAIASNTYQYIWDTNVTDYKWSRLKTSVSDIEKFRRICNEKRNN